MRRFVDAGFASGEGGSAADGNDSVVSGSMLTMYDRHISPEERKRVAKLEIFDELEEWRLLMAHYCFTVAVRGSLLRSLLFHTPLST